MGGGGVWAAAGPGGSEWAERTLTLIHLKPYLLAQDHAWVAAGSAPLDLEAVNGPWVARSQAAWTPEAEEAIVAVVAKSATAAMAAMGSGDLNEAELDDLLNDEDYDF